ncbi:hypothetical protein NXV45_12110 [Phocaeicola vulgatus]|nr:hypothetical protein [Phocaeicola vulgatus]
MKKTKIKVGDKEFPCRVTMGAMVRFKNESGKDVSKLEKTNISELVLFVYCCVKSACNADKVEFDYDFQSFADLMEPDAANSFYEDMGGEEKKRPTRRKRSKRRGTVGHGTGVHRDEQRRL